MVAVDVAGSIQTLKVTINQQENVRGWVDIYMSFDQTEHQLKASYAFPPFEQLIQLLRDMLLTRLPSIFEWDEEGVLKRLRAEACSDPRLIQFFIESPSHLWGYPEEVYFSGLFEKRQFVVEFHRKLTSFLVSGYDSVRWTCGSDETDLSRLDLDSLERLIREKTDRPGSSPQ